ncbi:MAG: site-specific integrase [Muribaculaceae bacterium]|nr:site-specific integrase [Muribaculaceae bacterium]
MANVRVSRRSDAERKDGKAPLYAVFCLAGKKVRIPLNLFVTSRQWDSGKQLIKGSGTEIRDKNLLIANTLSRINEILIEARLRCQRLTKEEFLFKYHNPGSSASFAKYALERIERLKTTIEFSTYRHHKTAIEKLIDYSPDITFMDITSDWLRVYAAHLRKDLGNAPGTVAKNMGIIRTHFMAGAREGRAEHNPFENFRMPKSDPQVTFLTEEELTRVCASYRDHTLPAPEHEALRIWLFMAFTGMHISDLRELRIEYIYNDEIRYRRKKTKVAVSVPLSLPAKNLYKEFAADRRNGFLLPDMPSDQWFNRRIKLAMERMEIRKNISAKSARHTFATIFYRRTKDIGTLSKLLGHTSVKHTMVYTHIINDAKIEGISSFDSFA